MKPARFQHWRRTKQWTIYELAFLLHGWQPVVFSDIDSDQRNEMEQEIEDWKVYAIECTCKQTNYELGKTGNFYSNTYNSSELLHWVSKLEGLKIPNEFSSLLPEDATPKKDTKWGYTHDTKLLNICRWVVVNYWEGKDHKKVSSKVGVVADLKKRFNLSDREAQAIDLVTRHDKIRKLKHGDTSIIT